MKSRAVVAITSIYDFNPIQTRLEQNRRANEGSNTAPMSWTMDPIPQLLDHTAGPSTGADDQLLESLVNRYGPKWTWLVPLFPTRSRNNITTAGSRFEGMSHGSPPLLLPLQQGLKTNFPSRWSRSVLSSHGHRNWKISGFRASEVH
jgi:hypothetical protein